MLLRPSWTGGSILELKALFLAEFGKPLHIIEREYVAYIQQNDFKDKDSLMAHFRRAIAYYRGKYKFLPTFRHLISDTIPALVDIEDWEKALYNTYGKFQPILTSPGQSVLNPDTKGYSGLYTSLDTIRMFCRFVEKAVALEKLEYCEKALLVVERLIFSMAYRQYGRRIDYINAIDVQKRLAMLRRTAKSKNEDKHWSYILVQEQEVEVFSERFRFWELPKLVVNYSVGASVFGIPRYGLQHAHTVMMVMGEYAFKYEDYLEFILTVREGFLLDGVEKQEWKTLAPSTVPAYPY